MSKVRIAAVSAAAVASLAVATAGYASSNPKGKAAQEVTVNVLMSSSLQKGFTNMVAGFERANPNIKVRVTYAATNTQVTTVLLTQLNGGNPPDIALVDQGTNTPKATVTLATANRLADLSKEPWVKSLPKSINTAGLTYKGKTYAYPFSTYFFGVIYNSDLFSQLKLKVPKTTAQLIAMCKSINAKGYTPFANTFADPNVSGTTLLTMMGSHVYSKQPNWNALRTAKKTTYAKTPGWKTVVSTADKMIKEKCFSPGAVGGVASAQYQALGTGKAVMAIMTTAQIAAARAFNANANFGVFPFPGIKAKETRVLYGVQALAVLAGAKQPAAAKKVIEFLSKPVNQRGLNKITGATAMYDVVRGTVAPSQSGIKTALKKKQTVALPNTTWPNPTLTLGLGNGLQTMVSGQLTGTQLLGQLDYLWNNPTATTPPR